MPLLNSLDSQLNFFVLLIGGVRDFDVPWQTPFRGNFNGVAQHHMTLQLYGSVLLILVENFVALGAIIVAITEPDLPREDSFVVRTLVLDTCLVLQQRMALVKIVWCLASIVALKLGEVLRKKGPQLFSLLLVDLRLLLLSNFRIKDRIQKHCWDGLIDSKPLCVFHVPVCVLRFFIQVVPCYSPQLDTPSIVWPESELSDDIIPHAWSEDALVEFYLFN